MKFGEKLLQSRYEPWLSHYLDYDKLKTLLKEDQEKCLDQQNPSGPSWPARPDGGGGVGIGGGLVKALSYASFSNLTGGLPLSTRNANSSASLSGLSIATNATISDCSPFVTCLNEQVERILFFFLQEQGRVASELEQCREALRIFQRKQQDSFYSASIITPMDDNRNSEDNSSDEDKLLFDKFYQVALHLLKLIEYADLNMTGIRKILKKHDKVHIFGNKKQRLSQLYLGRRATILQPLNDGGAIDALTKVLESELSEFNNILDLLRRQKQEPFHTPTDPSTANPHLRNMSENKLLSFSTLPSEVSPQLPAAIQKSLSYVHFADCQQQQHEKIYHGKAILLQIKAARSRLKETSDFVKMLAAPVLVMNQDPTESFQDDDDDDEERLDEKVHRDNHHGDDSNPSQQWRVAASNFMNYFSTFLYMSNYYIVAPASHVYAEKLGGDASQAGIIIGMTPVAALISTLLYSWWTSYSYKSALVFASVCCCIGNFCYGLGLPMKSLRLVLIGRMLTGFGSARSINRRYIADRYNRRQRTAASATLVTASALGCSVGPAVAAVLEFAIPKDDSDRTSNPYWQIENAPGWILFVVWSLYLFCLILFFKDPPKRGRHQLGKKGGHLELRSGEHRPLLAASATASSEITVPVGSTTKAKMVNLYHKDYISVIVPLAIYFLLKLILETTLSSIPMMTNHYFRWTGRSNGAYLAILALMVLPANAMVGYFSTIYEDRDQVIAIQICMVAGCLSMLNFHNKDHGYPLYKYLFASFLCYVSTSALEGPNMSLLSKTIPKSWSEGFFNIGLLATEAGTAGRAVADVLLTAFGAGGMDSLLNRVFEICSGLSMALLVISLQFYKNLVPRAETDDLNF